MKKLPITSIATATQLSKSTVSRYFTQGYVSKNAREKIENFLDEHEIDSFAYRQSHLNYRNTVLVITPLLKSPNQSDLAENICIELGENQLQGMIVYCPFKGDSIATNLIFAQKNQLRGVILLGTLENTTNIEAILHSKIPIVSINQQFNTSFNSTVLLDDYHAGKQAIQQLIYDGHTNIALLLGIENATAAGGREQAFFDMMKSYHLDCFIRRGEYDFESGVRFVHELIESKYDFTAIIACNDLMSAGVASTLLKYGYRIPKDCSIIGFGDSFLNYILSTPISSMCYDFKTIAKSLVHALGQMIDHPFIQHEPIIFQAMLKDNGSTFPLNESD